MANNDHKVTSALPRPSLERLGGPSTSSIAFSLWLTSAATSYTVVKARWPSAKQLAWKEDENLASAHSEALPGYAASVAFDVVCEEVTS